MHLPNWLVVIASILCVLLSVWIWRRKRSGPKAPIDYSQYDDYDRDPRVGWGRTIAKAKEKEEEARRRR